MFSIWAMSGTWSKIWEQNPEVCDPPLLVQHCLAFVSSCFEDHSCLQDNFFSVCLLYMGVVNSSGTYLPSVSAPQGRSSSTFVDSTEPSGLVQPRWWVKEQDGADRAPVGSYCLPWKVPLYLPSSSPPSKEANYSLILPGKKLLQASLHKSHLCKLCILLQQLLHLLL